MCEHHCHVAAADMLLVSLIYKITLYLFIILSTYELNLTKSNDNQKSN